MRIGDSWKLICLTPLLVVWMGMGCASSGDESPSQDIIDTAIAVLTNGGSSEAITALDPDSVGVSSPDGEAITAVAFEFFLPEEEPVGGIALNSKTENSEDFSVRASFSSALNAAASQNEDSNTTAATTAGSLGERTTEAARGICSPTQTCYDYKCVTANCPRKQICINLTKCNPRPPTPKPPTKPKPPTCRWWFTKGISMVYLPCDTKGTPPGKVLY